MLTIENCPYTPRGWYCCDWGNYFEAWLFDTKAQAVQFGRDRLSRGENKGHLNIGWLSPTRENKQKTVFEAMQEIGTKNSLLIHDMRGNQ